MFDFHLVFTNGITYDVKNVEEIDVEYHKTHRHLSGDDILSMNYPPGRHVSSHPGWMHRHSRQGAPGSGHPETGYLRQWACSSLYVDFYMGVELPQRFERPVNRFIYTV